MRGHPRLCANPCDKVRNIGYRSYRLSGSRDGERLGLMDLARRLTWFSKWRDTKKGKSMFWRERRSIATSREDSGRRGWVAADAP